MSIVRLCPYDKVEHCKYERYYGEPMFSKCKNCEIKIVADMKQRKKKNTKIIWECPMKIEWFDAKKVIPLPKKLRMYKYSTEVISDKGDLVCYDYEDEEWKKIEIEYDKVSYISVEITEWINKPHKED